MASRRRKTKDPLVLARKRERIAINAAAARVLGLPSIEAKAKLLKEARALRQKAEKSIDQLQRDRLLRRAKRYETSAHRTDEPKTGPGAVKRAKHQLERVKWERANRRGR